MDAVKKLDASAEFGMEETGHYGCRAMLTFVNLEQLKLFEFSVAIFDAEIVRLMDNFDTHL